MQSKFFAALSRMKYINRWGLMRNTRSENLSEHCLDTAMIAHALVVIHNRRFGGRLSAEHAACLAMYHDAPEIITGDMPTPVKYYNPQIRSAYAAAEAAAQQRLVSYLPEYMRDDIAPLIAPDEADAAYMPFVKAADKLSALAKCIAERGMGNREFFDAERSVELAVHALEMPEAEEFIDTFMQAYSLTLDEQEKTGEDLQ